MAMIHISIHPPRAGRDKERMTFFSSISEFQSTLPVRGGTVTQIQHLLGPDISIHPPRAGRDRCMAMRCRSSANFNPPSPCGEGHWPLL